jgi:hypothetical protein
MIKDLMELHTELEQLKNEKQTCLILGEGFSLRKADRVYGECRALDRAMENLLETAANIERGY